MRKLAWFVIVAALAGCAPRMAPLPPAPSGLQEIAVAQPTNKTGVALTVDDPGLLGKLTGESRSTVPDVLAEDLRSELSQRGFQLAHANASGAPTLQVEIRRWAPYSADYSAINVDLVATLLEPTSGRTLWTAQRTNWNVPTRDARSSIDASMIASRAIATTLLDGWQPERAARPAR